MSNKDAIEFFARLFGGLNVARTGNIGGKDVQDAFTCSLHVAELALNLTASCHGEGLFQAEAYRDFMDNRIRLLANPSKVGFERACRAFEAAYQELKGS